MLLKIKYFHQSKTLLPSYNELIGNKNKEIKISKNHIIHITKPEFYVMPLSGNVTPFKYFQIKMDKGNIYFCREENYKDVLEQLK